MLAVVGSARLDELIDAAVPGVDPAARRARPAGRPHRGRGRSPSCARSPAATRRLVPMIGLGYSRHITPPVIRATCWRTRPGTPPTRRTSPRSPRAGSRRCSTSRRWSRDLTGLPTAERQPARRGHRRRRGDDAVRRRQRKVDEPVVRGRRRHASRRPSRCVRTRAEPLGIERAWSPTSTDGAARRRRASACCCSTPGTSGAVRDHAALIEAGARPRRAGRRRRRPARADAAASRRARSAPTSWSAPPSASACRWASAARTPATWPCATGSSATCPAGWSASRVDADGAPGLPARAADPRAAHPPREGDRPTSAPPRCCSP